MIYDDSKQTPEKLAVAIDRLGFRASVLSVTAAPKPTLYVEGLTDLMAARKVEQVLEAVKGVTVVTVDPKDGEVYVEYDGQVVRPRDLLTAVNAAGFKGHLKRQLVATTVVAFGSGKWELDKSRHTQLLEVVKRLRERSTREVDLEGYTDDVGARPFNLQLSQRRAEAARRFLIENGVDPHRVQATGLGDAHPMADNTTKEGRAQNRRVVIKLFDLVE